MTASSREAAETLRALDTLRLRTIADASRRAWLIWLFWALVYVGSIPVVLRAPDWAIGLYWLCAIPIAVAAGIYTFRRLPRRDGVVPIQRPRAVVGGALLVAACFATAPISPLGPWLAVAVAFVAFGWVWPRRLAIATAALLATTAVVLVVLLDDREAAAATAGAYAAVFVFYGLYERRRLNAPR
jgi:hypothetical protein